MGRYSDDVYHAVSGEERLVDMCTCAGGTLQRYQVPRCVSMSVWWVCALALVGRYSDNRYHAVKIVERLVGVCTCANGTLQRQFGCVVG